MDANGDEGLNMVKAMAQSVTWRVPSLLPERADTIMPRLESKEFSTQNERMKMVAPSNHASDLEVPKRCRSSSEC
jgi:hypothetical protein